MVINKTILTIVSLLGIYGATKFFDIVIGPSMNPTFHTGDILIINPFDNNVNKNDIIVFNVEGSKYVKRVAATNGYVNQNGEYLDSERFPGALRAEKLQNINCYHFANRYWVLGDNEQNSTDSREYGLINKDAVVGKVVYCVHL